MCASRALYRFSYQWARRGDPLGRPRSFMPTRSFMAGTNKSRGMPRGGGRLGGEGEAVPRPYGRPRSFMPTRSFMALCAPDFLRADSMPRGGGRRGASPDEGEAWTPRGRNGDGVGATHWVALGHSCQRARSWFYVPRISSAQTPCLGVVGDAGRRRMRARQCLAPTSGYSVGFAATRRNLSVLPRILGSNTMSVRSSSGRRKVSGAATMSSPAASMTVRA